MKYLLRIAIAFDGLVQATFRYGSHGVTISSRIGTAAAHGHTWGLYAIKFVDGLFGVDHCKSAIGGDIKRARAAIKELRDPVVTEWCKRGSA